MCWRWCERCRQMVPSDRVHMFRTTASPCLQSDKPLDLSVFEARGEWLDKPSEKRDTELT